MNSKRYKYNLDRRTIYFTILHIVTFLLLGTALYYLYDGGFFSAWFTSFVVAMLLLMTLSIPRNIEVSEEQITINCVLDITKIEIYEIVSIRKVSPRKIRWSLAIFGGSGFFGYYGHFFDFRNFRRILIYASEWRYLVEIVNIYEDHIYISCRNRDKLIRHVQELQNRAISKVN